MGFNSAFKGLKKFYGFRALSAHCSVLPEMECETDRVPYRVPMLRVSVAIHQFPPPQHRSVHRGFVNFVCVAYPSVRSFAKVSPQERVFHTQVIDPEIWNIFWNSTR